MAINKLKDLYKINPEYGAPLAGLDKGKYKYIRQTDIKKQNFTKFVNSGPILNKNDILISRVGSNAGETYIHTEKENYVFAGFLVRYTFDNTKLINKYFYYWTKTNKYKNQVKKFTTGSGQPQFNPPMVSELEIFVPNICKQQKIIDIIEPLEFIKINLLNQLESISKYTNFITIKSSIIGKMNEKCQFLKGESVDNFSKGKTLFLNVAAANGNPNKYCDNDPNIFPGDITLSLDGNTGLVNNNLLGFNGYLYNVKSNKISNWLIYYSLKHKINQNIIKLNETGTTIKHSANSKKELVLLKFKYEEILQNLFILEINLKKQITLIDIQIKKMISLLIK